MLNPKLKSLLVHASQISPKGLFFILALLLAGGGHANDQARDQARETNADNLASLQQLTGLSCARIRCGRGTVCRDTNKGPLCFPLQRARNYCRGHIVVPAGKAYWLVRRGVTVRDGNIYCSAICAPGTIPRRSGPDTFCQPKIVIKCAAGFTLEGSKCKRLKTKTAIGCAPDHQLVGKDCVPNAPKKKVATDCAPGFQRIGQRCISDEKRIVINCAAGFEQVGNACVRTTSKQAKNDKPVRKD